MLREMNQTDIEVINNILDQVLEQGLEVECIYWALVAMKENPRLSPGEAFALGLTEWIK
jgi:hypothetical protein